MFTLKEKKLLREPYFTLIRETDNFIEVISENTKHCWIVFKNTNSKHPITLYHKHSEKHEYYHRHYDTYTVALAVVSIKSHDKYVLS